MVGECLECLLAERPFPHRLFDRWLGEKPPIYDDARTLLSAFLLSASRWRSMRPGTESGRHSELVQFLHGAE